MRGIESRVLEALDLEGMIEYLRELISVPSHGGRETEAQENVAANLADVGFGVDSWEIDLEELRRHPAFSMSIEREGALGVVGTLRGTGGGRSLILNGHVDTVAPGEEANWGHPPLQGTVEGGRIYGRGACDMKGGLCCALFASKAVIDAGVELKGDLVFESVIGEEDGGAGSLAAVLRGYGAEGAIVMEPTELKVAPAHAGALQFRVDVTGRSAHACVREEGVSAIEKFIPLYGALRDREYERNSLVDDPLYSRYTIPYALNIGRVRGGSWPGSVAESLCFEGRLGVAVGEGVEEARGSLEDAVRKAAEGDAWLGDHPPRVEWVGYQFEPARVPIDRPIVSTIRDAFADATGKDARLEGMTYASDMRHLVNTGGTPSVLFGPGDVRNAHGPDEYVPIGELKAAAQTIALTILRFCGCEEP